MKSLTPGMIIFAVLTGLAAFFITGNLEVGMLVMAATIFYQMPKSESDARHKARQAFRMKQDVAHDGQLFKSGLISMMQDPAILRILLTGCIGMAWILCIIGNAGETMNYLTTGVTAFIILSTIFNKRPKTPANPE